MMMFQAITSLLVAATAITALPIARFNVPASNDGPAPLVVKRTENIAQVAQGSNFYFTSLHLETLCTPGQFACVGGSVATCSPEANWEVTEVCSDNKQCYAIPDSTFVNGVNVQCSTEADVSAAITAAGGDGNVSQDFSVQTAPFNALADPNAQPSSTDGATTPTESQGTEEPTPTDLPTEEAPSETAPTEDPAATCTDEEAATVTETVTLILVPNATESGAYDTYTGEIDTVTAEPQATETVDPNSEAAEPTPTETCIPEEDGEGEVEETEEVPAPAETTPAAEETPAKRMEKKVRRS